MLAKDSTVNTVPFAVDTSFYPGASINVGFLNRDSGPPGTAIASYDFTLINFVSSVDVPTGSERSRSLVAIALPGLALARRHL